MVNIIIIQINGIVKPNLEVGSREFKSIGIIVHIKFNVLPPYHFLEFEAKLFSKF